MRVRGRSFTACFFSTGSRAAGRASERHPCLAALGGQGASAVFSRWLAQLSCALQKANVACLRGAGAGARNPATGVNAAGAGLPQEAAAEEEGDWLEEEVEELLLLLTIGRSRRPSSITP